MTNLEFFSRVLLVLLVMLFYGLLIYIMMSYQDHSTILNYNIIHKEVKWKHIKKLYKENKNKGVFLFIDLDPGFLYELFAETDHRFVIHFYRTSIEVREASHLYYYNLGLIDFIKYQIYYFIIFRFTSRKPNIGVKNLKYDPNTKRGNI